MKRFSWNDVADGSLSDLHEGCGTVFGGTVIDREQLGGGAWRFVDWWRIPPGAVIGRHRHDHGRELYVVLDGAATMTTNSASESVTRGDMILNEPGDDHSFANTSNTDVLILVIAVIEEDTDPTFVNC